MTYAGLKISAGDYPKVLETLQHYWDGAKKWAEERADAEA